MEIPIWAKVGIWLVRRESLPSWHPESCYNYIKKQGEVPEEYGFKLDLEEGRCV